MFKSLKLILFLAGLAVLSACVQSATQVKSFADASGKLAAETRLLMTELDYSKIERDLVLLANDKEKLSKSIKIDDLKKIKAIYQTTKGQQAPVIRALSALQQYSDALGMLSSANFREDIDLAAQNLYGSFSSMGTQYQQLTGKSRVLDEKSLGLLTSAIDGIGIVIVEQKRREAIKLIVITSDPHIAVLTDAVANKIDVNIGAVKQNYKYILNERILEFRKRAMKMKLETRLKELRKLKQEADYLESIDMIYLTAKQAVLAVKEAHAVLRETVSQDKFSSARMSRSIGQINSLKKHLKSFSRAL